MASNFIARAATICTTGHGIRTLMFGGHQPQICIRTIREHHGRRTADTHQWQYSLMVWVWGCCRIACSLCRHSCACRSKGTSADLLTASLEEMLLQRGAGRKSHPTIFIGHSYGTFIATRVLQIRPDLFEGLVLLDPMCFMLQLAKTTHSFGYEEKPCSFAGFVSTLVCTELLISICMRRHFHWHQNCLWLEDLAAATECYSCCRTVEHAVTAETLTGTRWASAAHGHSA